VDREEAASEMSAINSIQCALAITDTFGVFVADEINTRMPSMHGSLKSMASEH
jgi:hypothetical protein